MRKMLASITVSCLLVTPLLAENFPDSVSRTALTASVSTTQIYTAAPMGLYRVSYYVATTTAGSVGTATLTIAWNDGAGAQSFTTGTLSLAVLAAQISGSVVIWSSAQQNISYATTLVGVVGSPQYAVRISLERLQ